MNKQRVNEQIKKLEEELTKLKDIAEAPEGKATIAVSELSYGDNYFVCGAKASKVTWMGSSVDNQLLSQGKIHLTKESAELEAKYNKLNQELRVAMAEDWGDVEVDWRDIRDKWCIVHHRDETYRARRIGLFQKIHFRTEEAQDKFYHEHTEEELKLLIKGL